MKKKSMLKSIITFMLVIAMVTGAVPLPGVRMVANAAERTLSGSDSCTAQDGDVLTGTTSGTVTIANNASITLSDATITGGIVCEGTATITLVGTNSVSVVQYNKAGIQIGGSGTTLTIRGDGSLTATGGSAAAGIGLGRMWDASVTAGAIVIEGGTVNASGDIGIGIGTVGNSQTATIDGISIKGGTVSASLGKGYIYNGSTATVGYIKIYDTIDMVDASKITETVTYMHVDGETATDVTANKTDYFTIGENGDRRIIVPKDDTNYTITIADGIENGTITGATTAKYMETVTINATPDFGYRFVRLVVKDADNNDVASTNNTFQMPKSNVTVSAVFEQGTHGTTEFTWFYSTGPEPTDEVRETIYDGATTVNIQQTGQSYNILKYDEYTYSNFRLDNNTYDADIPYAGGTGGFYETGNATNFSLNYDGETGYYDITMTDVGNGKWGLSILPTAAQMDVVPDQTYTGSAITPEPLVIAGSLSLTKGTDYVYSYDNNTNVGTATVRATFQGDYESLGYVEKTFTIKPSTIMVNVTGSGTVTIGDKSVSDGEAFGVMSEKGASVVLTLAPESGNVVRSVEYGYTNSKGTNRSGVKLPISDGTATLTVPNDLKDGTGVTLTVTFAAALVGGADEAGAVALTDAAVTDLAGGWYKVTDDITFDHTLNLLGDTHLTIADGKTMTVNTATDRGIDSDYTLTVRGAGALSVTASGSYPIAVRVGSYVQTGATVTASGFIGIRCCDVFDADVTNDLTFSGGQLTVTGTSDGIWADNTITISCTNASDFIQSSSYEVLSGGTIKVADGKALTDGTNIYTGTLTSEQISAIAGKKLECTKAENPATVTGTVSVKKDNHTVDLSAYVALNGATGTVSYEISGDAKGCTLNGSVLKSGSDTGNVTVNVMVAADDNYLASSNLTITVTVTDKETQTISFADKTMDKTWGDEDFTVTATGEETNVSYAITSGDAATVDASTGKVHIVKTGTTTITAIAEETTEYAGASASYSLTINKKAVTVKADNKTMVYGASEPELTATVTGLVGSDTVAYTLSRAEGTAIGTYTITPTGDASQGNYTVTYETGTFTITDKPIYAVTVEYGSGGGNFEEGATVTITANAPETGKEFDKWTTSDGVTFANANSASTTFTMPAKAVTVTATYKTSKTDPVITKAPAARTGLVYNGQAQALITAGEVAGGTFYYALGDANGATQPYTTSIPTATNAGTYYVWYKVKGDETHTDSAATGPVKVTISEAAGSYSLKSAQGAEHTLGEDKDAVYTITNSADDNRAFERFTQVSVDGTVIAAGNYTTAKGSLVLTLKSAYLNTLTVGEHTVKISFTDGEVSTSLKILKAAETATPQPTATPTPRPVPKTGDASMPFLWLPLILTGILGIGTLTVVKRRK